MLRKQGKSRFAFNAYAKDQGIRIIPQCLPFLEVNAMFAFVFLTFFRIEFKIHSSIITIPFLYIQGIIKEKWVQAPAMTGGECEAMTTHLFIG